MASKPMTGTDRVAPVIRPGQLDGLLRDQTAVVTGASSGIGKGIAIQLAAAGARVVVNYATSEERAREVVNSIKSAGGEALAVQADASHQGEVEQMFKTAVDAFGTVDILINNAGLQQDAWFESMTDEQWQKVLHVNLTGQFYCAQAAVREFKRRGLRPQVSCALGKIVCISSVHEVIPWAGHVNYAASKGGVMMLMKSLAQELAPSFIRVNSIAPGAIRTPINKEAWSTPEAYEALMKLVPYKRIGEPEDIGRTTAWLVSDLADYIHGASIFVDGGMTLYPGFESGG